jgi:signal peptidase I
LHVSLRKVLLLLGAIILLFVGAIILFFQAFGFYEVYGDSMSPALKHGEVAASFKWDKNPRIGEIIVFHYDNTVYIKRVVALEGSTVEAKDGRLYVNGKQAAEDYLPKVNQGDLMDFEPVNVPADAVFVLGDVRAESFDSRDMGPIPKERIRGTLIPD